MNIQKEKPKRKFRSNALCKKKVKGFKGASSSKNVVIVDSPAVYVDTVNTSVVNIEGQNANSTVNNPVLMPAPLVDTQLNPVDSHHESEISFNIVGNDTSNSIASNSQCIQNNTTTHIKYRQLVNRSAVKLKNSMFKKQFAGKTRSSTLKLGSRNTSKNLPASCNKIVDANLLAASVCSAAICGKCRRPNSKLILLEDPNLRRGLVENLAWESNLCFNRTTFTTSKRCKKDSKKTITAYETNVRSVYA